MSCSRIFMSKYIVWWNFFLFSLLLSCLFPHLSHLIYFLFSFSSSPLSPPRLTSSPLLYFSLFFNFSWEYYSMIYVRSNNSIRLFPRASLALFLLYHFYLFSSPAGFHLLALLVLFLFLTSLMVSMYVCINVCDVCTYVCTHVFDLFSAWLQVIWSGTLLSFFYWC